MTRFLIVNGSPRAEGRCARIAKRLVAGLNGWADHKENHFDGWADHGAKILDVGLQSPNPCTGCEQCKNTGVCSIHDSMSSHLTNLAEAGALLLVSPVYFAGPSAQLKAFFDRLQPYYWQRGSQKPKRPAHLFVVREGGDPHGFEPLVTIARSSLAIAGFQLEKTFDFLGLYDRAFDMALEQTLEVLLGEPAEGFSVASEVLDTSEDPSASEDLL